MNHFSITDKAIEIIKMTLGSNTPNDKLLEGITEAISKLTETSDEMVKVLTEAGKLFQNLKVENE
jgi:hypothetical protein